MSATKRGSRSARGRSRTRGVTSSDSNIGYTATRSPPRSRCPKPTLSIASFTDRARSTSTANARFLRACGRKSFSSS
ncbi:MAG TPA: hypothetical protein VHQ02_02740 [Usitatibacter sp.]|nr:hypothetical protein [Usitatibacter sp.]